MLYEVKYKTNKINGYAELIQCIQYLYSDSKLHSENEKTKLNSFLCRGSNGLNIRQNTNPEKYINEIKSVIDAEKKELNMNNFSVSKYNVFFAYKHKNNEIFTNIFKQSSSGEIKCCLSREELDFIATEYFDGNLNELIEELSELIRDIKKVHHFDNIKRANKEVITRRLVHRKFEGKTVIAMTHIDEDEPFHIHTIEYND